MLELLLYVELNTLHHFAAKRDPKGKLVGQTSTSVNSVYQGADGYIPPDGTCMSNGNLNGLCEIPRKTHA